MSALPLLTAALVLGACGGILAWAVMDLIINPAARPSASKPLPPPATQSAIKSDCLAVSDWVKWNPWYLQDEAWRLEAQAIHLQRQQTHPGEPLEVNLVHVAQEMRRRHGDTIAPTLN